MKNRLISLFLALVLAGGMFSCSESKTGQEGETETQTSPAAPSAETASEIPEEPEEEKDSLDAREDVSDNLPDADFGGRTFTVAGDNGYESFYLADEPNGEVVHDAIWKRNQAVSERFNIALDANVFDEGSITANVQNSMMAGDEAYQLISGHIIYLGMAAASEIMYDMNDLPHIDFSRPWWSDSTKEDLTYKGITFIAIGDFALSAVSETYCMFYNKEFAVDYGLPDMYDLVYAGEWTIGKQMELSEGVYQDLNGDGRKNKQDMVALSSSPYSAANAYLWAFGKKIATQQPDGTYDITYYDEKLVSIMETLHHLYHETDQVFFEGNQDTMWTFEPKRALFADGVFNNAVTTLRDVEFDYGIIPYPKWDTQQEAYYTSVDGGHEGLAAVRSISDPEFVGTIIEALCAESWKKTVPAYYDVALKYKGARDYESIAMIDMIMDSRIFDFGYVYGGWGPVFWIQSLLTAKNKDIASYYQRKHREFDNYMEKIYAAFDKYADEN